MRYGQVGRIFLRDSSSRTVALRGAGDRAVRVGRAASLHRAFQGANPRSGRRRAGAGRQRRGDGGRGDRAGAQHAARAAQQQSAVVAGQHAGVRRLASCFGALAALVERRATSTLVNRASRPRVLVLCRAQRGKESAHSARDFFPTRPPGGEGGRVDGGRTGQGFGSHPPCARPLARVSGGRCGTRGPCVATLPMAVAQEVLGPLDESSRSGRDGTPWADCGLLEPLA